MTNVIQFQRRREMIEDEIVRLGSAIHDLSTLPLEHGDNLAALEAHARAMVEACEARWQSDGVA